MKHRENRAANICQLIKQREAVSSFTFEGQGPEPIIYNDMRPNQKKGWPKSIKASFSFLFFTSYQTVRGNEL